MECGLGETDRLPWNAVFVAGGRAGESLQMKGSNMICSGLHDEARTLFNLLFFFFWGGGRARSSLKIFCLHCNI